MRRPWLMLLCVVLLAAVPGSAAAPKRAEEGTRAGSSHPSAFYDAQQFFKGLNEVTAVERTDTLIGGLVPHHILAGSMFSRFYLELERQPPATVIVVGPNHDNRGARIATGVQPWTTPFGQVEVDQPLVEKLVAAGLATVDDGALDPEHSVGSQMPYIKYHAPGARVVPLIFHRDVSIGEIGRLAEFFAPLLGRDCILVASVDFSHYLTRPEAEAKDKETLKAIRAEDLPALYRMGPDHLDSPASLGLLLLTMKRLGAAGPEILGNTNSGVIIGSDMIETTSYFTLRYGSPP